MPQRRHAELGQPCEHIPRFARAEDECDPLGQQAPSDEGERTGRRAIEPVRVVDGTEQRSLLRNLGHQAEDRQSNQERGRNLPGPESERDGERVALGSGQMLRSIEQRRAQLLQRRVRELHLSLDPDRPQYPELPSLLDRPLQQRGLPDPRFTVHHQDAAFAVASSLEQPPQHLALAASTDELAPG
jgi:hypothetical protein